MFYPTKSRIADHSLVVDYQRDEHRTHLLLYHLVWSTRRSKAFLEGDLLEDCTRLITDKCRQRGWKIEEIVAYPNAVHVCLLAFPEDNPDAIVRELKKVTSFSLRKKYADSLSKVPSIWNRNYLASTVWELPAETIDDFIESQKGLQ